MPEDPQAAGGSKTTDALELLRVDHREITRLVQHFEQATDAAEKRGILDNIVAHLGTHTLLEEELIYPAVRRLAADEAIVDRAAEQHAEIDRLLQQLEETDPRDERCDTLVADLAQTISGHFREEEGELFERLHMLGDEELTSIGQKLVVRREESLRELRDHGPDAPASVSGA